MNRSQAIESRHQCEEQQNPSCGGVWSKDDLADPEARNSVPSAMLLGSVREGFGQLQKLSSERESCTAAGTWMCLLGLEIVVFTLNSMDGVSAS